MRKSKALLVLTALVAFAASEVKARNVDPSIADEANKAIATYSSYFPTLERLFFNEIKEGSSYNVGCWIGETTIVRASR